MGGEKLLFQLGVLYPLGSPPHGRGKVVLYCKCLSKLRITPAWAGKRYRPPSLYSGTRDHPRMGGEKLAPPCAYAKIGGSPPHGRGKVETRLL